MEEDSHIINLEDLANSSHPCLADGDFSVFHDPQLAPLILRREIEYSVDLDGVILSKSEGWRRVLVVAKSC